MKSTFTSLMLFKEALVVTVPGSEEHRRVGQAKTGLLWLHHFYFYTFIAALDFTACVCSFTLHFKIPLVR